MLPVFSARVPNARGASSFVDPSALQLGTEVFVRGLF